MAYQIDDLLVVDLHEGALDQVLNSSFADFVFNAAEQILQSSGHQSPHLMISLVLGVDTHHGEGLPRSCLPIGKNGTIIPWIKQKNIPSMQYSVLFLPTFSNISC